MNTAIRNSQNAVELQSKSSGSVAVFHDGEWVDDLHECVTRKSQELVDRVIQPSVWLRLRGEGSFAGKPTDDTFADKFQICATYRPATHAVTLDKLGFGGQSAMRPKVALSDGRAQTRGYRPITRPAPGGLVNRSLLGGQRLSHASVIRVRSLRPGRPSEPSTLPLEPL